MGGRRWGRGIREGEQFSDFDVVWWGGGNSNYMKSLGLHVLHFEQIPQF